MKTQINTALEPTPVRSVCLRRAFLVPAGLRHLIAFLSCFLVATSQLCFAGGDTNMIVISEWSKPVSLRNERGHDETIRGRLLIIQGMEPAYGGPPTTNG